jgi:hypothetical protein
LAQARRCADHCFRPIVAVHWNLVERACYFPFSPMQ